MKTNPNNHFEGGFKFAYSYIDTWAMEKYRYSSFCEHEWIGDWPVYFDIIGKAAENFDARKFWCEEISMREDFTVNISLFNKQLNQL